MKKQTVLFLITKSNWGGAQRYVYDLATSLPPESFTVAVAVGGNGPLKEKLEAAGVTVHAIPSLQRNISIPKELKSLFEIASIITQVRPDVLHINSSKAGGTGALIGRVLGVPRVIFTAHGWAFNEDRPTWQKFIITFLHWITVLLTHRTIAVSEGMKAQLTWPGAQRNMIVVHPGRTIPMFSNRSEARSQLSTYAAPLSQHQNDFWIGTIAELHPIKRLERAIAAVANLIPAHPTLRYIIIGDGELRPMLEQQISELRVTDHVFLTGPILEAARLLPALDAFVLPSKSESYGYVLVEAGHAHLPVVATNTGGITDLITHDVNGLLVPTDNTEALTTALDCTIRDQSLAQRLADKHHTRMKAHTVQRMVTETIAVYRKEI